MTGPLQPPAFMGNPTTDHSARLDRLAILGAMFRPSADGLGSMGGALWGPAGTMGELTLVNPTTLRCAPARFVIPSTLGNTQGTYEIVNPGNYDMPVPPQDVTQYRRGLVVAHVRDAFATGSGVANDGVIEVIPGDLAASNPQLPSVLPDNRLLLGEVNIPPVGGTVTMTPYNPRTGMRGGILPILAGAEGVAGIGDGEYRDHPARGLERWRAGRTMWETPGVGIEAPMFVYRQGGGFAIGNNTFINIGLNAIDLVSGGWTYDASAAVCPRSGVYWVSVQVQYNGGFGGRIFVAATKNGAFTTIGRGQPAGGLAEPGVNASGLLSLAAGDKLSISSYQDSGATQTTGNSPYAGTRLEAMYLRPL